MFLIEDIYVQACRPGDACTARYLWTCGWQMHTVNHNCQRSMPMFCVYWHAQAMAMFGWCRQQLKYSSMFLLLLPLLFLHLQG